MKVRFSARDAQGQLHQGHLDAPSEADAVRSLQERGLTPVSVVAQGGPTPANASRRPVKAEDRVLLLREMATLLAAGVTLGEALPGLAQAYAKQALGQAVALLDERVRQGRALSEAIESAGLAFPPYVLALVKAGEASGALATALDDAAEQLESARQSVEELKSALVYPTILVVAGVLAILLVFVGVVPRFAPMLRSARADVPEFSRWVIEAGVFVKGHWEFFAYAAGALVALAVVAMRQAAWRQAVWQWLTRLPAIGPWLIQGEIGRWATVLGALLANRVPIVPALDLSVQVLYSAAMREGVSRACRDIQQGSSLADALAIQGWFPPERLNLIRVGERSGELPKMLLALGKAQREAARTTQRRLLALIEPAAILVIGGVIAMVMISVMLVITSMNQMAG